MSDAPSGKQPLKQLAALFERDHHRLIELLDAAAFLCRKGSYSPAAKVFGEFRHIIEQHAAAEERALDTLTVEGHCPRVLAAQIAAAHAQLNTLVEATWQTMQHDGEPFEQALESLKRAIAAHERIEQEELLPALCGLYPDPTALARQVHHLLDR